MSHSAPADAAASTDKSSVWSQKEKDNDRRVPTARDFHPSNARFIPGASELMSLLRPSHMPRILDQFLLGLVNWEKVWAFPHAPRDDSTVEDERYEQMIMTKGLGERVSLLLGRLNACPDLRQTNIFQSLSRILSLLDSTRQLEDYSGPILMPGAPVVVWYTVVQKCIQFFRTGKKRHLAEDDYDVEWYINTFCAFMLHMWASPTPIDAILYMTLGSYATVICEHTHSGVADLNIMAAKVYCARHPNAAKQQHEARLIATAIECDRNLGLQKDEDGFLVAKEIDVLQGNRTSLYNALDALEPGLQFSWSMQRKVMSTVEDTYDENLTKTTIVTEVLHAKSSTVTVHSLPGEDERMVCHPDIATINEQVLAQQAILVALKRLCREYQQVITAYIPLVRVAQKAREEWQPLITAVEVKKKALKKVMACLSALGSIGFSDEEETDAATKLTKELGDSMASYVQTKNSTISMNEYMMDMDEDSRTKSEKIKDENLPVYNKDVDESDDELPTENLMGKADISTAETILELAKMVQTDLIRSTHNIGKANAVLNVLDTAMNRRLDSHAEVMDFPTYNDCEILVQRAAHAEATPGRKIVTFGNVEQITGSDLSSMVPTQGHWVDENGELLKPNGSGAVELTWMDMPYPDNDPCSLSRLREVMPDGYSTMRTMGPMHGTGTPMPSGILRNALTMRGGTSVATAAKWNMPGARQLSDDLSDYATQVAAESMRARQESLKSIQKQQVDQLINMAFPPGYRLTSTPLDQMHPPPRRGDISSLRVPTFQISPLFKAPPPIPQRTPTEVNPQRWKNDRLFVWGFEVDKRGWEIRPIICDLVLAKSHLLETVDGESHIHILHGEYQAWPLPVELSDDVMENILHWELPLCRDPGKGWQDCYEWALRVGYPTPPIYFGAAGNPHNVPFDHLAVEGLLHSLENTQNATWQQIPS